MQLSHAVDLLADSGVAALGQTTWANLGCGTGTFTIALATLLAEGSTIHAVDRDGPSLLEIPAELQGVRITTHQADFMTLPLPPVPLDGILMANSLHYVRDQPAFIRRCASRLTPSRRFLIVEYDTDAANRWVPYPVARARLAALFGASEGASIRHLASRPSRYQRAPLYAALISS